MSALAGGARRASVVFGLALVACAVDPGWQRRVGSIEATLQRAEEGGAMRCAPQELALGRAHLGFAELERERGHHERAQEHLAVAEPNASAALYLSPPGRCAGQAEEATGAPGSAADPTDPSPEDTRGAPTHDGLAPDGAHVGEAGESAPTGDGPATELPATEPPATDPPATELPATEPPATDPPATEPPAVDSPALPDQDQDGVPDRDDECPLVRGEAGAACPGAYPGLVVRAERLVLLRPVALDSAGAADEPTRALLRAVVEALNHRPAMVLEVGAHTDAEGSELENLAESQRRAERVRELLIQAGAPAERVRARGYGEELPIESNSTPEGRAANQRIEVRRVEAGAGGF